MSSQIARVGIGGRTRTGRGLTLVTLVGMSLSLNAAFGQGDTKTRSYFGNGVDDRKANRIYDISFMKLIADQLNGKASALHIVMSVCRSGGFAAEADRLTGDFSLMVARSQDKDLAYQESSSKDTYKGETGYKGAKEFNFWGFGLDAQWAKKLDADPNATANDCFTAAKANEFDKQGQTDGFPKLLGSDAGKAAKIVPAAGKGEAVVWSGYTFSTDFANAYATLQRRGYTDGTVKNARIDAAYDVFEDSNFGGRNPADTDNPPVYVDRKASGSNLKTMVQGLSTRLAADGGGKTGLVYISSHGNTAKVKADVLPDSTFGAASQGADFRSGDLTRLDLDTDWVTSFFEGTQVITPGTTRVLPASISISTLAENFSGLVGVTLNGIAIGDITLLGSAIGGSYRVNIPDSVMSQLYNNTQLTTGLNAEIAFDFGAGPSTREFKIATEWDVNLGISEFYGVALEAPSIFVPSPASAVVLGIATLSMTRRSRRPSEATR